MKNKPVYTYDSTRKLGALIPIEVETKVKKEAKISQVVINQVKTARDESTWTSKDVTVLRASALCEIAHYYRALKENLLAEKKEAVLSNLKIDREYIALDMMKGLSVDEAFKKGCKGIDFNALLPDNTEG